MNPQPLLSQSKIKNQKSKINNQQSSFINPVFLHGQIVLVQFNSMGNPENGGRFTVKKYHSTKTVSEDACQALPLPIQNSKSTIQNHHPLRPLNPDYDPIPVTPHEGPEMVVVGEWVATID
jgi:hypothetical protein